jgi:hypothetical protein
VGNDKE